jgi:saccharopine dehydrogenase-like NADP-dependent oxidoreductase
MKIAIIGCGGVGSCAATLFAREDDVKKIVVADANKASADNLCRDLKEQTTGKIIEAFQVDATNTQDVIRVIEGADFVYNGAFPLCNIPILKACLEIKASYMDAAAMAPFVKVQSEDETIESFLAYDSDAKVAGITAITCCGIAPGWSNIASRHMITQMDSAETVRFKWFNYLDSDELIGTWWPAAMMMQFLGGPNPYVMEDGEIKPMDDWSDASESYLFPEPIGKRTAHTAIFHPEIWMLPEFLPDGKGKSIKQIDVMGGMDIGNRNMKDVWIEALHRQTIKPSFDKPLNCPNDLFELMSSGFIQPADFKNAIDKKILRDDHNITVIEVTGVKDGKKIKHSMYNMSSFSTQKSIAPYSSSVSYGTSYPGVTVALMVLRGEIKQKGALVPDQLEKPTMILEKMASSNDDIVIFNEKIERDL